jgi:penicillin amidase
MRRIHLSLALALLAACSSAKHADVSGGTGLGASVEAVFDDVGMPHVVAQSESDAAFAMGYLHARDRFWEMDLFRRNARGKISELVGGAAGRPTDVQMRTLFTMSAPVNGSYRIEDGIAAGLRPEVRALLERYRDGVNRWLEDLKAGRNGAVLPDLYRNPLAMTAQDLAPWEIQDSIAIGRLQSWLLSDSSSDEMLAGELAASGADPDLLADLFRHAQAFPSQTLPPPTLVSSLRAAAAGKRPALRTGHLAAARGSLAGARAARARVLDLFGRAAGEKAGSNNWTIGPSRSATGNVLVANDPHLALYSPPIFHLGQIILPDRSVAGVWFPGIPGVVIGTNDKVAWGDTVVGYDVTDVYVERLVVSGGVASGVLYAPAAGGQVEYVVVNELWKERSNGAVVAGDPIVVKLVPHHGPVVPGSEDVAASTALTVRWTGNAPTQELEAFWLLGQARNVDDAMAAVGKFGVGAQNFVFGDTAGNIGYFPRALVPIRKNLSAAHPPWLPMPGEAGDYEWTGFVPDAELPQARNPASGYVSTANNDIDGSLAGNDPIGHALSPGGHYWYAYTDVGFRQGRIQQVLTSRAKHTQEDMTALQADTSSLLAATTAPAILSALAGAALSADEAAARDLLAQWADPASGAARFTTPTGLASVDPAGAPAPSAFASQAAALFHVFFRKFEERVLADDLAAVVVAGAALQPSRLPIEQHGKIFVSLVKSDGVLATGSSLCNDVGGAAHTCAEQVVAAFKDAVAICKGTLDPAPANWRWGKIHRVAMAPPLGLPGAISYGPFANDGGLWTVDVANFSPWGTNFRQTSGPNVRYSAEMTPAGPKFRAVIPGGQVMRAGDAHEQDQIPLWLNNAAASTPFEKGVRPFTREEVYASAQARVTFAP